MYFLLNYALVSFGKQKQKQQNTYSASFFSLILLKFLAFLTAEAARKDFLILQENKVIKLIFCLQENEVFGTVTSTSHVDPVLF